MEFKVKPMYHQLLELKRIADKDYWALFWDMGTGKTFTAINWVRQKHYQEQRNLKVIVLCPKVVQQNWKDEFEKYSSMGHRCVVMSGTPAQIEKQKKIARPDSIWIVNFDKINFKIDKGQSVANMDKAMNHRLFRVFRSKRHIHRFNENYLFLETFSPDVIIIDESQRIKTPGTCRTVAALELSKLARYRLLLSGTPMPNSAMDIWSQALFLDMGISFGRNFSEFRNTYFIDSNILARSRMKTYFPNWILKPGMDQVINEKISGFATVLKKSECLDLPEKVYLKQLCEMSSEQKTLYNGLKKEYLVYIEDAACTVKQAAEQVLRMNQLLSGYLKTEDGVERRLKENPKLNVTFELLEDLTKEHKVIVWAIFRNNIFQLLDATKEYNPACIFGDTTDRPEQIRKFNEDASCRVMIANPKAAGLGVNLCAASYVIYFSRDYNLEDRMQSEDRCHRKGSEIHTKITYIDLVFPNTVDVPILDALRNKKDLQERLLDRDFWLSAHES